ncbi:Flavodoxin [Candidatus Annandia adelgestsuga]|uniref:Flavodoxin n=1 Tax=Candidatus Annandia adelgestsuga TaxID=1302411 RepID=A0A3S9J752_9ENTR|nr:flavodoxin FldA [Candidatus Annandia adelgestsuga]AZP36143.1 Flavodoxin [Candidatus Annandia adelgestsuga]
MKNKKIGIFFGSDTGNTENVAKILKKKIGKNLVEIYDIANSTKEDIEKFNNIILGISTWYYGEPQCDWDDFLPTFKKINFKNKLVAIFGCGDQEEYSEYFCDAMIYLYKIVILNGGKIIGNFPNIGYNFKSSKSLLNNNFIGLPIDEDNQKKLTKKRIKIWIKNICKYFN